MTDNSILEKYCYEDNPTNCATYGGLYQWEELMPYSGIQDICPGDWHLPTDAEWTILTDFLGGVAVAGGNMKSTGTIEAGTGLWYAPNSGATNASGFTALAGGSRLYDGSGFHGLDSAAIFWSSTADIGSGAHYWLRSLIYNSAVVGRDSFWVFYGFSVRCLHDEIVQSYSYHCRSYLCYSDHCHKRWKCHF